MLRTVRRAERIQKLREELQAEEAALIADIDADNNEYRTPLAVLAEIAGMSHATLHRRLRAYRKKRDRDEGGDDQGKPHDATAAA